MPTPRQRKLLAPKRRYDLLYDAFPDTRAAGTMNGTFAQPGPGKRTVVDTEGKITQAGGQLVFAGGKAAPAWGDPGRWYEAVTRVAGRVLLARVNITGPAPAAGPDVTVGFDTLQSGIADRSSMYFGYSGGVYGIGTYDAANLLAVGIYTLATSYTVACILRTAGCFYLIKGGAFTNFTLLRIGTADNSATLFPAFANFDAVLTADNIRISTFLRSPVPLASDSFTRANGALGTTDGLGHQELNGGAGLAWQFDAGVWTIATNKAVCTPTLGAELATGNLVVGTWYSITATEVDHFYVGCAIGDTFRAAAATALDANNKVKAITLTSMLATVDCGTPNVKVRTKAAALTAKTQQCLVGRLDSAGTPANFIIAYFDGSGNVKADECVAGAYTNLVSGAKAFTADDELELDVSGTAWRLYHITSAGVATLIGSGTTNVTTGSLHGLFSTYASNTFSAFQVWGKGTDGRYAWLDQLG